MHPRVPLGSSPDDLWSGSISKQLHVLIESDGAKELQVYEGWSISDHASDIDLSY